MLIFAKHVFTRALQLNHNDPTENPMKSNSSFIINKLLSDWKLLSRETLNRKLYVKPSNRGGKKLIKLCKTKTSTTVQSQHFVFVVAVVVEDIQPRWGMQSESSFWKIAYRWSPHCWQSQAICHVSFVHAYGPKNAQLLFNLLYFSQIFASETCSEIFRKTDGKQLRSSSTDW